MALVAAAVLERDNHGNALAAWQYPGLDDDVEQVLLTRWSATLSQPHTFSRFKGLWLHVASLPCDEALEARFPKVSHIAVAVLSDAFNPEKFIALSKVLLSLYVQAGHPLTVLQCYLGVFCRGKWQDNSNAFDSSSYPVAKSLTASPLKSTLALFGEESVLIWCAMLMKKRVAVLCEDVQQLQSVVRSLPLLVLHRGEAAWSASLWPLVCGTAAEAEDLRAAGDYVAGFANRALVEPDDAYDVLVDVGAQSVVVSAHAADDFALGRLHKDVATFMVESSSPDAATEDAAVVEGIAARTKNVISKLESLKAEDADGHSYVTMDNLRNVGKVGHPLDRFLFAVAQAEGMTKRGSDTSDTPQM
eukprot:m51a1_g2757 hypothetical protein (360) ;mRNA; f:969121-970758